MEEAFGRVMEILETRRFAPGTVIVREGDESTEAYVIRSGTAEVSVKNAAGREVPVAILDDGEIFGEMGLILDRPRSATVRARTAVEVDVIDPRMFTDLFAGEAGIRLRSILQLLCERLRLANTHLVEVESEAGDHLLDDEAAGDPVPLTVRITAETPEANAALGGQGEVEISRFPFRVGRLDHGTPEGTFHLNDLCLVDDEPFVVSRSHFSVVRNHNTCYYQDRGSKFGAMVNGKRVGGGYRNVSCVALELGRNTVRLGGRDDGLAFGIHVERGSEQSPGFWEKVRGTLRSIAFRA